MNATDTFADAAFGVADTGQAWVLQETAPFDVFGAYQDPIVSSFSQAGGLAGGDDADYVHLATIDHGWSDGTIDIEVEAPFAIGSGVGTVFRYQDSSNFWLAMLYRSLADHRYRELIQRVQGGAITGTWVDADSELAGFVGPYGFTVTLDGNAISLSGGLAVVSIVHATATKHGIAAYFDTTKAIDTFASSGGAGWVVGAIAIG